MYTMSAMYGNQGEFVGNNTGIWSSGLEFSAIAANVGLAGVTHYTTVPFSSFKETVGAGTSITIA